jgi:autophagy-related protein 5
MDTSVIQADYVGQQQPKPIFTEKVETTDDELHQQIWKGEVPVMFVLTPNEVIVPQPPTPYYKMVPRNTYFPLVTASIRSHFALAIPFHIDELWLDYQDKPLKWHLPVGVLFDMFSPNIELPWKITVHFQGFPANQILRCPKEETIKEVFFAVIKEAIYMKFGDTRKYQDLPVNDTLDLWKSFQKNDYSLFCSVSKKLNSEDLKEIKSIPIRLFFVNNETNWIQEPVPPFHENGQELTLGDVIKHLLPAFPFSNSVTPKVLVQGVLPDLETPITWLYNQCHHIDHFLYLILVNPPSS